MSVTRGMPFKHLPVTAQQISVACVRMGLDPNCAVAQIAEDPNVQHAVGTAAIKLAQRLRDAPHASNGAELQTELCSFDNSNGEVIAEPRIEEMQEEEMPAPSTRFQHITPQDVLGTTTTTQSTSNYGILGKEFDAPYHQSRPEKERRRGGCVRSPLLELAVPHTRTMAWDQYLRNSSPGSFCFPSLGFDPVHIYPRSFYFSPLAIPLSLRAYHAFSQLKSDSPPNPPVDPDDDSTTSPTVPCAGVPGVVDQDRGTETFAPLLMIGVVSFVALAMVSCCYSKARFLEILKTNLGKKLHNLVSMISNSVVSNFDTLAEHLRMCA